MRIVVINQFFWPEVAPTGQYLTDLTRYLAAQGHQVTVICSKNSYGAAENDGQTPPPVRTIRVVGLPFKRSALARLLSYFTFFTGAIIHAVRTPSDMVVSMTTPPLLGTVGALAKILRGSKHYIWEMDVFPDVLYTTGTLSKHNPIVLILSLIQRLVRRHADGVIALGPCMKTRLIADGTPAARIHIAENWADSRSIAARSLRNSEELHILYSGNLGRAHDVGTVNDAIRYFRNDKRVLFSFAGSGVGRETLQRICLIDDIRNVRFPSYVNRTEMSEHLAKADIGLVTQLAACVGTVVPSKVYGLMAAGRPILFVGPKEATPALLIERFNCGWQVDPGDARSLIAILERLLANRGEVARRGEQALEAFRSYYDLPQGVARVTAALGLGDPADTAEAPAEELQSSRINVAFSS